MAAGLSSGKGGKALAMIKGEGPAEDCPAAKALKTNADRPIAIRRSYRFDLY